MAQFICHREQDEGVAGEHLHAQGFGEGEVMPLVVRVEFVQVCGEVGRKAGRRKPAPFLDLSNLLTLSNVKAFARPRVCACARAPVCAGGERSDEVRRSDGCPIHAAFRRLTFSGSSNLEVGRRSLVRAKHRRHHVCQLPAQADSNHPARCSNARGHRWFRAS